MASEPGPASAALGQASFQRLHPAALAVSLLRSARVLLLPLLVLLFVSRKGSWEQWMALFFLPLAAFELYRYATFRYKVDAEGIVLRRGLLFASERHVPAQRIQNIDLVQTLLHRLLRVAEVRVETAGGATPEAVFSALSLPAIERLRAQLLPKAQTADAIEGADRAEPPAGDAAPPADSADGASDARSTSAATVPGVRPAAPAPKLLWRIPTWELVKLGLVSNRGAALVAVAVGVAWELDLVERTGLLKDVELKSLVRQASDAWGVFSPLLVLLVVLGAVAFLRVLSAVWMVLRFHGYELHLIGDELRVRCGLLTRVSATVPRRRIQLVSVRETPLQRWLGCVTVRLETAGGTGGRGEAEESHAFISRRWFVPTLPRGELPRILGHIRPGLDEDLAAAAWTPPTPRARLRMLRLAALGAAVIALAAMLATLGLSALRERPWLAATALLVVPLLIWHARCEARNLGYAHTMTGLLFRSGAWTRQTSATFFDKMQVLTLRESPFDRRWRMATLAIDTAGAGAADHVIRVPYLPRDEARALLEELVRRTEGTAFRW